MKKTLLFLTTISFLSGCVSSSKFKEKEQESLSNQTRAEALSSELKKSQENLKAQADAAAGLKLQLDKANEQLSSSQKSNDDLKQSLDANKTQLSQKVSSLIKERDEIKAKLTEAESAKAALAQEKASLEAAKAAELDQVKKSYEELTAGLKSEISAGQIQITQLKGKLTVNMVDQILFDSGHAEVKAEGRKVLDKVGSLLNSVADKDIRIEGHTDNKPIVGELKSKYPSNWELSTARATSVARYLQDNAKVDPKRLIAAGYGEQRPKAANDTAEGRAQNRRIEIILVPRE